jgi:hypothetical protein
MTPDGFGTGGAFLGAAFVLLAGVSCLFWGWAATDFSPTHDSKPPSRWWLVAGVAQVATCWLIGPWVAFGIWSAATWNMNRIDYIQRQPEVIPAPREVIQAMPEKAP